MMVAGAGLVGAQHVSAQQGFAPEANLVKKLAQKFGLQEADVQAVFDEERQERMTFMHSKFEDQLNQDVQAGKLTESQKQAILDKKKELQALHFDKRDELKDMTPEERKALFDSTKTELENWAKQNNLDQKYLMGLVKRHHPMMMKK